jgi:hypothetical protein
MAYRCWGCRSRVSGSGVVVAAGLGGLLLRVLAMGSKLKQATVSHNGRHD